MLKWETYKLLWNLKETLLQSSKSRFRRSGSDFSVTRFSECHSDSQNVILKMMFWVLKRTGWAQWYIAIAYLKDSFYIQIGELMGSPQSSFRRSNYRHHENSSWNEKPTTCFGTEKKRYYNHQNRVFGVLERFERKNMLRFQLKIAFSSRSRRSFRA